MQKVISVYFSGTGMEIKENSVAGRLHSSTNESESQVKFGFDGCGITDGFILGGLFGVGLDRQCNEVIQRVSKELIDGHNVTLNVYGFSRGGIAALMLAKQLSKVDPKRLSINLALLDPVPGNLLITARLDPFEISLANKVKDLTDCKPLKKVLALYLNGKFSAIACHAPLIATYPSTTEVKEDVLPGYHAAGESLGIRPSNVVLSRVHDFMREAGTTFNKSFVQQVLPALLFSAIEYHNRPSHPGTKCIVTEPGDPPKLSIQPATGMYSKATQVLSAYPWLMPALKWTLVGLAAATLLYATGGLAAIPIVAGLLAKLGPLLALLCAPVMAGALALAWYGAIKPVSMWCANKIFYPHYAIRNIEIQNTLAEKEVRAPSSEISGFRRPFSSPSLVPV